MSNQLKTLSMIHNRLTKVVVGHHSSTSRNAVMTERHSNRCVASSSSSSSSSGRSVPSMDESSSCSSASSHDICMPFISSTTSLVMVNVSIPLEEAHDNDEELECMICLDCMTNEIRDSLPCGHTFHRECVNNWRYQHETCPTCRCNLEFAEMHC